MGDGYYCTGKSGQVFFLGLTAVYVKVVGGRGRSNRFISGPRGEAGKRKQGDGTMRKIIAVWFLIISTMMIGCSSRPESNLENTRPPLTEAQINDIIRTATDSVIVDVDFSQISKPAPTQQSAINERMRRLGENLQGLVTMDNKSVVVARIDGEAVTASEWYWEKTTEVVRAEYAHESIPSNEEIFNDLIETKVISSTARGLGIYPPEEQIAEYIADQQKYMENLKPEEMTILIQAWNISEDEYFSLVEGRYADSLAKINWGVYLRQYGDETQDNEEGYTPQSPSWIDSDRIAPLIDKAVVEITPEGRQLGISY